MTQPTRMYGITTGDSSGIGPEVLLKAWSSGEVRWPAVVYGDIEVLEFYNQRLGYGVRMRTIKSPSEFQPGTLNVIDHALMSSADVMPGRLSGKSGRGAREYVVSATRSLSEKYL